MIHIRKKKKCNGCHACYSACPRGCISMSSDAEGFLYPIVNQKLCINCGICEKVCPVINSKNKLIKGGKESYVAFCKNDSVRKKSSSGGLFYSFAKSFLKRKGIVYGASYATDFSVAHMAASNEEELLNLLGSKYIQSKIGDTFKDVRKHLEEGMMVAFSGTPCQIAGLKAFLRKDYTNLFTISIVCHGVPSNKIWQLYLKKCVFPHAVQSVNFRDKKTGWKNYSVTINNLTQNHYDNVFFRAFLKGLILRPSCYNCQFKGDNIVSDVIIGDFWGIDNISPSLDDDRGFSLLIINTKKGFEEYSMLNDLVFSQRVNFEVSIRKNPAYSSPTRKNYRRKKFFDKVNYNNVIELLDEFSKPAGIKSALRSFFKGTK